MRGQKLAGLQSMAIEGSEIILWASEERASVKA